MEDIFVGGYFSSNIDLENGTVLTNKGDSSGMLIKYEPIDVPQIKVNKSNVIGGNNDDLINSVSETSDGGYICRRIF